MKKLLRVLCTVGFLTLFANQWAGAQSMLDQSIEYRDGKISLSFEEMPLDTALQAIWAQTGLQIVLPVPLKNHVLNLQLRQLPIEPAVRFLIASIGFGNFALIYDEQGRATRAVVVNDRVEEPVVESLALARNIESGTPLPLLTSVERDKLQKDIETWGDLKREDRVRLEERLKALKPSPEREELVKEYGRQVLGLQK
jgi:hypothetical protein